MKEKIPTNPEYIIPGTVFIPKDHKHSIKVYHRIDTPPVNDSRGPFVLAYKNFGYPLEVSYVPEFIGTAGDSENDTIMLLVTRTTDNLPDEFGNTSKEMLYVIKDEFLANYKNKSGGPNTINPSDYKFPHKI